MFTRLRPPLDNMFQCIPYRGFLNVARAERAVAVTVLPTSARAIVRSRVARQPYYCKDKRDLGHYEAVIGYEFESHSWFEHT